MTFEERTQACWALMSEAEKQAYLDDEDDWGERVWFAWYPVWVSVQRAHGKVELQNVWLQRVKRHDYLVHSTGSLRSEFTLLNSVRE
jgi:hypothetical protein